MNKFFKTTLVATFLATSLQALNIDEAVQIALKNNQDMLNKNLDVDISKKNKSIAKSSFLPKVDISYNYYNYNKLTSSQSYDETGTLSSAISYNLFNGFKDISNYEIANLDFKSSKLYLKSLKFDTILNVKIAYVNYLNASNTKDTFEAQYELFKKQVEDSTAKYEQGLLARNDLLQVQVNMSNSLQNLVKAKANVQIASLELSNILGGYDLSNETIEKLSPTAIKDFKVANTSIDNRSELKALTYSLEALEKNNTVINSAFYPKIDGSFSKNNYYADSAFGRYDSGVDEQNIASVSLSWNLFNGNSDITQRIVNKKEILKLNNSIKKTKLELSLQLQKAKLDYEVANTNFKTASLSLKQAKENYNIVKNRFNEGVSSSTDLIDANYLLTQGKQNYFKAYFDKYISIETLKRVLEIK